MVLRSLEAEGVHYAVFGGVALNLHGLVRATEDLDLFVEPTVENLERLKRALRTVYPDPSIDEIDVEELIGDYPAVRYLPEGSDLSIDVLTRLGDAFAWADLETQRLEVAGGPVTVISPRMLVRMKSDTVRAKDRQDAAWVREVFGLEEDQG